MQSKRVGLADMLTIANGLCGLVVIVVALNHTALGTERAGTNGLSHSRLVTCVALIVAGSIFDVLDGVAAHLRGSSGLGDSLDQMCDLLTFGVAPAMMLVASAANDVDPWRAGAFAVAAALVVAGMLRLARHSSGQAPEDGFYGLTMPGAAGAVIALVFLHPAPPLELAAVLTICALMVSHVPYPHQGRRMIALLAVYWGAVAAALAGALPTRLVAIGWLVIVPVTPLVAAAVRRRSDLTGVTADAGTAR